MEWNDERRLTAVFVFAEWPLPSSINGKMDGWMDGKMDGLVRFCSGRGSWSLHDPMRHVRVVVPVLAFFWRTDGILRDRYR